MVVLKCKMCGGDIQVDAEPHWGATLSRYGVEFEKADEYFDRALDADPECARAYMGKYLIENKFKTESDIVQSFVEHFKAKVEDLLQKSPGRFERTVFVTPDEASQQAVDALKNKGILSDAEIKVALRFDNSYISALAAVYEAKRDFTTPDAARNYQKALRFAAPPEKET